MQTVQRARPMVSSLISSHRRLSHTCLDSRSQRHIAQLNSKTERFEHPGVVDYLAEPCSMLTREADETAWPECACLVTRRRTPVEVWLDDAAQRMDRASSSNLRRPRNRDHSGVYLCLNML